MVSNCPRCQIVRGVKLSSLHGRCQIVLFCMMVSNCPRCQIVLGVKLSSLHGRCQIVLGVKLSHHRQLPDKGSLYKQDFLELVQKRIVPASFCRAHLTHHQHDSDNSRRSRKWACKELLLTKDFWRDLGKTKTRICGLRCFWRHQTRLLVARKSRI